MNVLVEMLKKALENRDTLVFIILYSILIISILGVLYVPGFNLLDRVFGLSI